MSEVKFCIVGNGPEQKNVYEFSKKFKNLDYLGRIDNKNIPSIYNASKIICIPSLYQEGYARVVLESLSCGIPIIATKFVSSHNEINNKNCIFLTDTDVESFRKQINEELSNDKKLKIASSNARMHSKKHYSSKNFENIIEKII